MSPILFPSTLQSLVLRRHSLPASIPVSKKREPVLAELILGDRKEEGLDFSVIRSLVIFRGAVVVLEKVLAMVILKEHLILGPHDRLVVDVKDLQGLHHFGEVMIAATADSAWRVLPVPQA